MASSSQQELRKIQLVEKYIIELMDGTLKTFKHQKDWAEYLGLKPNQGNSLIKTGKFPPRHPNKDIIDTIRTLGIYDSYTEDITTVPVTRIFFKKETLDCLVKKQQVQQQQPQVPKNLTEMVEMIKQKKEAEERAKLEQVPVEILVKPRITAESVNEELIYMKNRVDGLESCLIKATAKIDSLVHIICEMVADKHVMYKNLAETYCEMADICRDGIDGCVFIEPSLQSVVDEIIADDGSLTSSEQRSAFTSISSRSKKSQKGKEKK